MSGQGPGIEAEVDRLYQRLDQEAKEGGYHLNPDPGLTRDLVRGLLINQKRYGYQSCPCRLGAGERAADLDIICPCDYRDPDLDDFNTCYCGLYVSQEVVDLKEKIGSIPERRPVKRETAGSAQAQASPGGAAREGSRPEVGAGIKGTLPYPVWRCKVCGYLCAREKPPGVCPICKASRDRFEQFI